MEERRCFVPNCEYTDGVAFPKDEQAKKTWLEALNLKDAAPKDGDFVCLAHFHPRDLIDENAPGSSDSTRVKKGAVPSIAAPQKNADDVPPLVAIPVPPLVPIQAKPENDDPPDSKMCRVCMSKTAEKSIFDFVEDNITIMSTLMLCAYPLQILKTDALPKHICNPCLSKLKMAHYFRLKCLNTDKFLRRQAESANKRKSEAAAATPPPKKARSTVIKVDNGNFQKVFLKSIIGDGSVEKKMAELHKEAESETDSLEDVLAALEGKEQFVIENKDEEMKKSEEKKQQQPKKRKRWNLPRAKEEPKIAEETTSGDLSSDIGEFPAEIVKSVYNNIFCVADKYLFEYGLIKQGLRNVKCVVPHCPAFGQQKILEDGSFHEKVEVKIPHNHQPPDDSTKKKQMFFSIMKRKMQNDRSLNIRSIYEDFCKHDPAIKALVPLRNVINEICKHQQFQQPPMVRSFEELYKSIESERFEKLHFTLNCVQFYQEKFETECGGLAIVFGNRKVIEQTSGSKVMYVDASFKIESNESFSYQLVTVLVWVEDSYYPILFALINKKTQELFRKIFKYLHDVLAPLLRPNEIVTDFEANLYYALGETYVDSHIGGSVFYFAQNLYKKICSLNLSHDLETNSFFRNVYHMLLMLPLLPVNTILDGLNNIEVQAKDLGLSDLTRPIFDHIRTQWIINVTPELFCVHRLESRINENVIAPFKKLRDFLLLTKGKLSKTHVTIVTVVEKLIELEAFLQNVYSAKDKKSFGRDLSSYQKKNVIRAWQYIESHPKININSFFSKVLGYIKCMENQLWIWGFYRYAGDVDETLINAGDFSIVGTASAHSSDNEESSQSPEEAAEYVEITEAGDTEVVMEAVIDEAGEIVLTTNSDNVAATQLNEPHEGEEDKPQFETTFLKYVYH